MFSYYDVMDLKTKCPAFKNGCPFAKSKDDHEHVKTAIQNCPEFSKGCPFKDVKNLQEIYDKLSLIPDPQSQTKHLSELFKAMHDLSVPLEQTMGDCPVFHESEGCPFKTVRSNEGVSLVDPVESVSHDERILKDLIKFEVSNLKEKCSAFKTACPYAKLVDQELKLAIAKCPEFSKGCPFKAVHNTADIYSMLSKIPDPRSPAKMLGETFKEIHSVSVQQKNLLGGCPIFHNAQGKMSCPFKNVRSDGKHLVEPVVDVMNTKV